MQDRSPPTRQSSLATHGRTIHLGHIQALLEQGERFSFENFSPKSSRGYPNALSDDWLVWTHKIGNLVDDLDQGSPVVASIRNGLDVRLLGHGEDRFAAAKAMILNGLRAAAKLNEARQNIPAADRIVALNHNSQAYSQTMDELEKLIQSVRQINDYPDQEDKEQKIAELSAGQRLLSATRVRVGAVTATLEPALRWFIDKFSGAIVGQIAEMVWKAVQHHLLGA